MNLGENIYKLRTEKNMSQGDLADALEVSRQSVSKWENNSAVPELEKLMKMAQIFEVSLDELVSGETYEPKGEPAQPYTPDPEPKVIYVEKPTRTGITPAQVLGILLLSCTVLVVGLGLIFDEPYDIEDWLPLCIPIILCGILCLVTKRPLLWCSWVCAAGYWLYFLVLSYRWEEQPFLIILGILAVTAALLYTIWLHRKGRIHVPAWLWGLLTVVIALAALLLFVNLTPPSQGDVFPAAPSEIIIDTVP